MGEKFPVDSIRFDRVSKHACAKKHILLFGPQISIFKSSNLLISRLATNRRILQFAKAIFIIKEEFQDGQIYLRKDTVITFAPVSFHRKKMS